MSEFAYKCFKIDQGIVALAETEQKFGKGKKEVSLYLSDQCIVLQVNFLHIALLEDIVPHLINNPRVIIFFTKYERYSETSSEKVELDVPTLLQAKGAWEYKKSLDEKVKSDTTAVAVS